MIFAFSQIVNLIDPLEAGGPNQIISLESREFTPPQQSTAEINTKINNLYGKHALIQLNYIPSNEEKKILEDKGITLLGYIPNYAWLAKISKKNPGASLGITYISEIKTQDKIQPSILKNGVNPKGIIGPDKVKIIVVFFSDSSESQINSLISKYGTGKKIFDSAWEVTLKKSQLIDFAGRDIVQWIEDIPPDAIALLDVVRARIHANEVQTNPYNLHGNGYVVAMWDSGSVYAHPDYASRLIFGDNATSVNNSHATMVAGIVLGNGTRSQSCGGTANQWRGIATQAQLVSYDWGNPLLEHNPAINTYGADVSQNSWGWDVCQNLSAPNCEKLGQYDAYASWYDWIARGKYGDKITIVGAAGNYGSFAVCQNCSNEPNFPYGTVTGPIATAKNTLSVSGTNADNDGWWTYSSRGPTDDGRIKPDLSSPATKAPTGIRTTTITPLNCYNNGSGTSFSAPAVSGSVILIYEDYNNFYGHDPLPSTVRAILYHTAEDLGNIGPDYMYGYGRINIQRAIDLIRNDSGQNLKILEDEISNSQIDEYYINVQAGESELKTTIVWDDQNSTPGAGIKLLNNLNLVLISPTGVSYYPWILDWNNPSNPATTGIDSRNNMEQVFVSNPEQGIWTIRITGTTVPYAPQKYSLTKNILGFNNAPIIEPIGNKVVNEGETLIIDVNATDDGNSLTYYTNAGEILPSSFTFNSETGIFEYTPAYNDSGIYSVEFNVTDGVLWDEETITITVNDSQTGYDYVPGDVNGNGFANGIDVTYFVSYLKGGPAPPFVIETPNGLFYPAADVNGNCAVNGIDVTYFVSYLKGFGSALQYCPDYPPILP